MNPKDTSVKIKIILGYLIPALAGFGIVWYLFTYIIPVITTKEDKKDEIFEKVIHTGSTLSSLYESELLSSVFIQNPTMENYENYENSIEKVYNSIDSLNQITNLPTQRTILEKLLELLEKKSNNMLAIIQHVNTGSEGEIIRQSLSNLKTSIDSIPTSTKVIVREKVRYDTLPPVSAKKKNIWKRIGEVFSPSVPDTTTQIKLVRTLTKDTIQSINNTYDTVFSTVEKVLDNVQVEKIRNKRTISKKLASLLNTDKIINTQINSLLSEFQQESFNTTSESFIRKQTLLKKSGYTILVIGVLSILSAILFIIFIFNDLKRRKIYRKELEEARIQAEELMQSREKLLLTISHDIKSPLSSIAGYIELMNSSKLEKDDREYVNSMNHSIKHVLELLNNLLEYSRLEAKRMVLVPEIFSLHLIFEEVASSFYPIAKRKNLQLTLNNQINPDTYVETDKIRLEQILTNLLSNALKFTDKGEVSITSSFKRNIHGQKGWLTFSISDTGYGIPPEKREIIFEEFSQANNIENQRKNGSGFGLFIVKRIIDLFRGNINVTENKPVGCIFTVEIPVAIAPVPNNTNEINPVVKTGINVLVVDDDSSQLKLMNVILTKLGYSTVLVDNIDEAVDHLNKQRFDILITDIQLKNSTGFELFEKLKTSNNKHFHQLPIIAVSANGEYDKKYFIDKGFSDFVPKPFSIQQFEDILNNTIQKAIDEGVTIPIPISEKQDSNKISPAKNNTKTNHASVHLPQNSLYNLDSLYKMMDNDEDSIKQVLELFISSGKESIRLMQTYLEAQNYQEIKLLAHKMLPIFRQLEITVPAETLSFIEFYAINETDNSTFEEKVSYIIKQSELIFDDLKLSLEKDR